MKKGAGFLIAGMILMFFSSNVFAAGFALNEHSSRAVAMGGAFAALADDPSALFYNPAGITQLEGTQFMAGLSAIMPRVTIDNSDYIQFDGQYGESTETEDNTWWPPHLYATHKYSDILSFGFGIYAPFGLGVEFPEDWEGRYNSYDASIETVDLNPTLGVQITDEISFAVGAILRMFKVELKQKIQPAAVLVGQKERIVSSYTEKGLPRQVGEEAYNRMLAEAAQMGDIDQTLSCDPQWDVGFNLGIRYQPMDNLAFGVSYRSEVFHNIKGDAEYDNVGVTGDPEDIQLPLPDGTVTSVPVNAFDYRRIFFDADGDALMQLPDTLIFGVAYKPIPALSFEFDLWRTGWSNYNNLPIKFQNGIGKVVKDKDWDDAWAYRFGAEYWINDMFAIRGGYAYDESPIPDETIDYILPSNSRHLINGGIGFKMNNLAVDAYYTYLTFVERDIDARYEDFILEGESKDGGAHMMGITLSYAF